MIDYSKPETPADYKCEQCGATNCKLWREYQTFHVSLMCVLCTAKSQDRSITSMDEKGMRLVEGHRTDQIGWMVPAVPGGNGTYWGYSSVPQDGCDWWAGLPTFPAPLGEPGWGL